MQAETKDHFNKRVLATRRAFCATLAGALVPLIWGCAGQPPLSEKTSMETNAAMTQLPTTPLEVPPGKEIATFAGGCFWCTEAIFTELKGVDKVVSGYAGGRIPKPTYDQVCGGNTGHAEAIQITFDPKVISYRDLLHIFFTTHDPTTLNRQGADTGTQYRSAIFTSSPEQKDAAQEVIKEVNAQHVYDNPIVTEVTDYTNFYPAEDYHQDYYANNTGQGYCRVVITPKVIKFRQKYQQLLKK